MPGNKLAISYTNEAAGFTECFDTITLGDNGEFGFDVPFPAITPIRIEAMPTPQTTEEQRCQQIIIFAVPGEQAIVNGTLDNYTISGDSQFFKDLNELQQAMKPFTKQYKAIQTKYQPLLKANKKNKGSITTKYTQEMIAYLEAQSDSAFRYIKAHPDQEASATLLMSIAPRNRLEALDLLSDKAKTERIVTFYQSLLLLEAPKSYPPPHSRATQPPTSP